MNWSRIKGAFEPQFEVLTYDQRGHGYSAHLYSPYTYENYARDLKLILDELKWTEIDIIGHSMGARVALVFSSLYPKQVRRLVIEDITPGINASSSGTIEKWIRSVPVPFANREAAKNYLFGEFQKNFSTAKQALAMANFFYMNIVESETGAHWRFSLEGILETIAEGNRHDRWQEWESLKIPSLVIRGENSPDLPRADFDRMLNSNPRSRGVEIPDSGHWVHFDQPDLFKKVTLEFLTVDLKERIV